MHRRRRRDAAGFRHAGFRAGARRLGSLDINVVYSFGDVRQYRHHVRPDFGNAAVDEQGILFVIVRMENNLPGDQGGHERRVAAHDAHLTRFAGQGHHVGVPGHQEPFRRYDFYLDRHVAARFRKGCGGSG